MPPPLSTYGNALSVAVVGASGGIGGALVDVLRASRTVARVQGLSRRPVAGLDDWHRLDLEDEASIASAAAALKTDGVPLDVVIVATGMLQDAAGGLPEKSWRALEPDPMAAAFRVNAIGPALVARHFLPLLPRDRRSAFAALSARVGSITDNRLGGWYSYRASKAALNMLIQTLSVELARTRPQALCVGLHPGTVDTGLSRPFQANVPEDRLFSPQRAAGHLLDVLDGLTPADSGGVFAWDGQRIPA